MNSKKEVSRTTYIITDLAQPNITSNTHDNVGTLCTKRVNTRSKTKVLEVNLDNDVKTNAIEASIRSNSKKKLSEKCSEVYECINCPKIFSRLSRLKSHCKVHKKQKECVKFECAVCHETLLGLKQFNEHKKICEAAASKGCAQCERNCAAGNCSCTCDGKSRTERPFVCKECGSCFAQSGHLSIHKRTHSGEKPYTCEICNSQFKQISHLKTHVRTHTRDRPYQCSVCPASFTQNSSLKRHIRSHTGEKPYKCAHCARTFVVKSNMLRHLNTHTGERPFVCDLCPSTFGQAIDLKRHKISHTGVKPFKCEACFASFSRKNNLKWHQRTHSDASTFKCDVCFVGFTTAGDLKAHMRIHAPPKPFQCDVCPASFRLIDSLKRHKMIHTGERPLRNRPKGAAQLDGGKTKPHACPVCAAAFCEKRNLKRHVVSIHASYNLPPSFLRTKTVGVGSAIKNEVFLEAEDLSGVVSQLPLRVKMMPDDGQLGQQETVKVDSVQTQQICIQPFVSGAPAVQQIIMQPVQSTEGMCHVPHLMISGTPQTLRTGRPAGSCPNHNLHILSSLDGSYNQWQSWCFCPSQNISDTSSVLIPTIAADPLTDAIPQIVIATGIEPAAPDNTTHYVMNINASDPNQAVILNAAPQCEEQQRPVITALTLTS